MYVPHQSRAMYAFNQLLRDVRASANLIAVKQRDVPDLYVTALWNPAPVAGFYDEARRTEVGDALRLVGSQLLQNVLQNPTVQ